MTQEQVEFQDLLDIREPGIGSSDKKDNLNEVDDDEDGEEKTWKKRLQVALIHFALLFVSITYAAFGSLIFYHIESPHELSARSNGVRKIENFREFFVSNMWNTSRNETDKQQWLKRQDLDLHRYTDILYVAYKKEYIKFRDVTVVSPLSANEHVEDLVWTNPSALFFSITTLATIGYGNVVPVTQHGRIVCVIFALFGTPLAIITIGDLGKFVSECIIWIYKRYKKIKKRFGCITPRKQQSKPITSETALEDLLNQEDNELDEDEEGVTYEDILLHRIQVPVTLVFGILIMYIAFGAILFHILEGWSYVDSFYFCFISLTTVGFGDLVPRQHKYMAIMLTYIGVGLAVTTMCIDLVGRQYIWKIHYFGRKFKEADLLALLRRKRMIERRLAIFEQNVDIKQMYLEAVEKQMQMANQQQQHAQPVYMSIDTNMSPINSAKFENAISEWHVDNVFLYDDGKIIISEINANTITPPVDVSPISTTPSYYTRIKSFLLRQGRPSISSPSGPSLELQCSLSTSPSVQERELVYQRRLQSTTSWTPSGPDISINCSIHTSPSVYEREELYARMLPSYPESPREFEYEFRLPSPEFEQLAKEARSTKRLASCPGDILLKITEEITSEKISEMLECVSIHTLMEESQEAILQQPNIVIDLPYRRESDDEHILPPALLSPIESSSSPPLSSPSSSFVDDAFKLPDFGDSGRASVEPEIIYYKDLPVFAVVDKPIESEEALQHAYTCPIKYLSKIPPTVVTENYCFVLDGDIVKPTDVIKDDKWWKPTGRPTHYYFSDDNRIFRRVQCSLFRGRIVSAKLSTAKKVGAGSDQKEVPLAKVFKTCRYYSHWNTCTSFHRIVTVMSKVLESEIETGKRIFVQFLWRDLKESEKSRVALEYAESFPFPAQGGYGSPKVSMDNVSGISPTQSTSLLHVKPSLKKRGKK